MGYRNSIFIKRNNTLMEIPCDKKIYLDKNFHFSDEKHKNYTLFMEDNSKMILETAEGCYILSSKVFQKLNRDSDIELFHFINEPKEVRTRNKDRIIISNRGGDITVPGASDFKIEIFQDRTTYIEGQLYLNGKPADIKNLFEFTEEVQLFSGGLKFYFNSSSLIVEGNRELYTTDLICINPQKSEPESFPDYERSPRIVKTVPEDKINFKNPPSKHERKKGELLRIIMPPLAMAGVTAATSLLLKRGIFVIVSIASMSVTMVVSIINYIGRQKELKEENRLRNKVYSEYLLKLRKKLNSLKEKQQEALLYQNPSYDEIYEMTQNYKDRIYERMNTEEDFLEVCIGTAETEASYEMKLPSESIEIKKDPLTEELRDIYKYFKKAGRLPFSVNLKKGHLGIIGDREIIHEQLELIILQLAFMHSYHNLEFIFVYNRKYRKKFDYLKWLPHFKISALGLRGMVDCERDRELVLGSFSKILKDRETRMNEKGKEILFETHYLVIVDDESLVTNHPVMEFLKRKNSDLGLSVIFTSHSKSNLPENIKTVLSAETKNEGKLIINEGKYVNQKIFLRHINEELPKEDITRRLSALNHVKGIFGQIPESITFYEMYKVHSAEELGIKERWERNHAYKSLAVPLGVRAEDDILELNLHEKAHGPHGLIAGTTGSGKSEIIQSYILSLAVNFHPYEVGFLLIDYKGGGMAGMFKNLPHLLGTITNLDGSESQRAMASIKSELERRQIVFNRYGVNNINAYSRLFISGEAEEPMPHLFLISDEFAELKKEQPEFMQELISTARIGRSLGVHLILATQKPSGVVNDQIWSNSKFKLALKVQDESDSREIIKTPDAASITQPGRAYLQVGNNEIYELFQSAWSGAAAEKDKNNGDENNLVYMVNHSGQLEILNKDLSSGSDDVKIKESELEACTDYIDKLYKSENHKEIKKPWLPPLSDKIVSPCLKIIRDIFKGGTDLLKETAVTSVEQSQKIILADSLMRRINNGDKSGIPDCRADIGIIDIPERQSQEEYQINFVKEGNLAVFGASGFGKTVTLANIILNLSAKNSPLNLQFFILDFGNSGLISLKNMPNTRDYIKSGEKEKSAKFCRIIEEKIKKRKALFEKYAAPNFAAYNEISDEKIPAVFIVVDNYDGLKEDSELTEELIKKVSRDGINLGIYTIVSALRQGTLRFGMINNFKNKIVHYMYDQGEIRGIVGRGKYEVTEMPGRAAVKTDDVHIMQAYVPFEFESDTEYSKKLKSLVKEFKDNYKGEELEHIRMLPEELTFRQLKEFDKKNNDIRKIAIGLDAENVMPQHLELTPGVKLIAGGMQSGKTNMLQLIMKQLSEESQYFIIDSSASGLYELKEKCNSYFIPEEESLNSFITVLKEEISERKKMFMEKRKEDEALNPKIFYESLPPALVIIDEVSDIIGALSNLKQTELSKTLENAASVGFSVIGSIQTSKLNSYDILTKFFKNTLNLIILGDPSAQSMVKIAVKDKVHPADIGYLSRQGSIIKIKIPVII